MEDVRIRFNTRFFFVFLLFFLRRALSKPDFFLLPSEGHTDLLMGFFFL